MKPLQGASSQSAGKPPPTVLIVVDEVLVRMAVSEYLREGGYNVVETSDAQEAIEVMTSDVAVAGAFSDIVKPGSLAGFGLAQWVRLGRPDINVSPPACVPRPRQSPGRAGRRGGRGEAVREDDADRTLAVDRQLLAVALAEPCRARAPPRALGQEKDLADGDRPAIGMAVRGDVAGHQLELARRADAERMADGLFDRRAVRHQELRQERKRAQRELAIFVAGIHVVALRGGRAHIS